MQPVSILFVTCNPHEVKPHINTFNAQGTLFYTLRVAHHPVTSFERHKDIFNTL